MEEARLGQWLPVVRPPEDLQLPIPYDVKLTDDGESCLTWWESDRCKTRPASECLYAFVKLAEASPDDILGFARSWGVLGRSPRSLTLKEQEDLWICSEPLSVWKSHARQA